MRDIDSTENRQVQVETEDHTEESSLVVGKSPSTMRKRIFIILSLLSLYFLWGGTYLAMRIALQGFPPFILAGVRQLTAGLLLFVFLWLRKHELPTRKQWLTAMHFPADASRVACAARPREHPIRSSSSTACRAEFGPAHQNY